MLNLAFLALHAVLRPFRTEEENAVEGAVLLVLTLLPIVAAMVDPPFTRPEGTAMVVFLIVLPSIALAVWVAIGFLHRFRAAKPKQASKDIAGGAHTVVSSESSSSSLAAVEMVDASSLRGGESSVAEQQPQPHMWPFGTTHVRKG
jgi:hypothetical protein